MFSVKPEMEKNPDGPLQCLFVDVEPFRGRSETALRDGVWRPPYAIAATRHTHASRRVDGVRLDTVDAAEKDRDVAPSRRRRHDAPRRHGQGPELF